MDNFKEGDIVKEGQLIAIIKEIQNNKAKLLPNYYVELCKLEPVRIFGGFDNNIILESKYPLRASIVAPEKRVPIRRPSPYYKCSIDGEPVISIIEMNHFLYVHQLQNWIMNNAPDYHLRPKNQL